MSSEIEYLLQALEDAESRIAFLLNKVALLEMRIENLEKRLDEDESSSR